MQAMIMPAQPVEEKEVAGEMLQAPAVKEVHMRCDDSGEMSNVGNHREVDSLFLLREKMPGDERRFSRTAHAVEAYHFTFGSHDVSIPPE